MRGIGIPSDCLFEIDVVRTRQEGKLIINCYSPDGSYVGVSEFSEKDLCEMAHPIDTFLWEFESMADHVIWKESLLKEEDDGQVDYQTTQKAVC